MNLNKHHLKYLFLIFLAIIFSVALTFTTLELPRLTEDVLIQYFPDYMWNLEAQNTLFDYVRPIGYACLAIVAGLIIFGFKMGKPKLSKLGSLAFFIPAFGNYALSMFFLAGIGIFRILWLPLWDISPTLLMLGDVSFIPYWIIIQPLMFLTQDTVFSWLPLARGLGIIIVAIGLLFFSISSFTWLYGKLEKKKVFDFWIYRYSRHPQYLGFILWSYGVLLLSALSPQILGPLQPAPSLPWLISTVIIICVALAEENSMVKQEGENYRQYQKTAPFMLPLPRFVSKIITSPNKVILKKEFPQTKKEIIYSFVIYVTILVILSIFVVRFQVLHEVILRNHV